MKKENSGIVKIRPQEIYWEVFVRKTKRQKKNLPHNGTNPVFELTFGFGYKILMTKEAIERLKIQIENALTPAKRKDK